MREEGRVLGDGVRARIGKGTGLVDEMDMRW
jgi:hypothetical protein